MAIEVDIESRASGGLRIIRSVPAIRPCRLEGRNGVGKSAFIRVLMLASGEQPYLSDPGAWRSLKRLVGSTVVRIDGLEGSAASAKLVLTPELWPEDPPSELGSWLGTLELDGSPADTQRLFEMLDVVHVTGTERLIDTLLQRKAGLVASIRETKRRLQSLEDQRAELGEIAEQLERVSPQSADEDERTRDRCIHERTEIASDLKESGQRLAALTEASGLRALLDAGKSSGAEEQLSRLRSEIEVARVALETAEREHEKAVVALDLGTKEQKSAARLERRLSANETKLDRLASRQEALGSRLKDVGIDPEVETLDESALALLDGALAAARSEHRDALRDVARASRSDGENQVLDELRIVLESGLARGLGDLVIADVEGLEITVSGLLAALGYVAELAASPTELADVNRRVVELSELQSLFGEREEVKADSRSAGDELASLKTLIAEHDGLRESAETTRAIRDEASAHLRTLNMRLGAMSRAGLMGAEAEDAERRVDQLLSEYGVAQDQLTQAIQESQLRHSALAERDETLATEIRGVGDRLLRRRLDREALKRRWAGSSEFAWLVRLAAHSEGGESHLEWSDATWQALSEHVGRFRKATGELVRQVEGLESVGSSHGQTGPYAEALDAVVETDAIELLSARAIADAIFDGGEVVRVDLEDESVTWKVDGGETRTRPLSAFSSGEQALGFMRARLQEVASVPHANRLLFLDEFGAFIAADRRRPLADLLTTSELRELSNQIVVVLPLQTDYSAELSETTGDLHELFQRRAEAVQEDGYFTEVFSG